MYVGLLVVATVIDALVSAQRCLSAINELYSMSISVKGKTQLAKAFILFLSNNINADCSWRILILLLNHCTRAWINCVMIEFGIRLVEMSQADSLLFLL